MIFQRIIKKEKPFSKFGKRLFSPLFLEDEGLTVGALDNRRVHFVGTYGDTFERAVVFLLRMVCTLLYRTLNALIAFAVLIHKKFSSFIGLLLVCPRRFKI